MAYIDQKQKTIISAALKPVLAKYGVKGTLSIRHHSTITLTLSAGPIDFRANNNAVCAADHWQVSHGWKPNADEHYDVNPYHFARHYSGTALAFLTEAFAALKSAGWYDDSDAMTDYFNTAYYYGISIGRWKKPYVVTTSANAQQVAA